MANKMYKVVAEELKKEEEDIVEPDVELSDRDNKIGDFLPTRAYTRISVQGVKSLGGHILKRKGKYF